MTWEAYQFSLPVDELVVGSPFKGVHTFPKKIQKIHSLAVFIFRHLPTNILNYRGA